MFWSLNIYLLCNSTVVFTYWTNNPFDLTFTTVLSIDVSINLKKKNNNECPLLFQSLLITTEKRLCKHTYYTYA